jgi:MoxR-like ATPase
MSTIDKLIKDEVSKAVELIVGDRITQAIEAMPKIEPSRQKIDITNKKKVTKIEGLFHHKFMSIVRSVSANNQPRLVGDTGSGKSFLCKQVADALDMKFYCIGTTTQEHKLVGYSDANGNYVPSVLFEAIDPKGKGGVLLFDELDSWCPNVSLLLNSLLSNGYIDIPKLGMVYKHPDCHVIGAMNTTGKGATREYSGRNRMDAAFLARFKSYIEVDYDLDLERAFAHNIECTEFVINARETCQKLGIRHLISPRQGNAMAEIVALGATMEEAAKECVFMDLGEADILKVSNAMS